MDAENRPARLVTLGQKLAQGSASSGERIAATVLLLDEGRFEEAFRLHGVELDPALVEAIDGRPLAACAAFIAEGHPSASPSTLRAGAEEMVETHGARWAAILRRRLHAAAPWQLGGLLGTPTGSRKRIQRVRLFGLPHTVVRRPGVFLQRDDDALRLHLDFVATSGHAPEPLWSRPFEFELKRFGLSS